MSSLTLAQETHWLRGWLHPGKAIHRRLIDDEWSGVRASAACLGIAQSTAAILIERPEISVGTLSMALLAAPLGGFWGCVYVWMLAYLLRLTGSWCGGYVQGRQMRTVVAFSIAPLTIGLGVMAALIVMFFDPTTIDLEGEIGEIGESERNVPAAIAAGASLAVGFLGSLLLLVAGTRVAERLSWPRAFAAVVLALTIASLLFFVLPWFMLAT